MSEPCLNLVLETLRKRKQAIVFTNTKSSAEKTAEDIVKHISVSDNRLEELSHSVLHALSKPTRQCEKLAKCVKSGIAFHHAGLTNKQRELIEEGFKRGLIKIICATPTLAMGVDLPAFRVILKSLKRYGYRGMQYIPVLEYLQMAGRAGRPNYDKYGEAIIIAKSESEKESLYEKYILGQPEKIYSKLAVEPVLRIYVLSLIATNFVNRFPQLLSFFEKTFWAYQYGDIDRIGAIINRIISLLIKWGFVMGVEDFRSALELDDKYRATPLGKRVAELYIDPLTAYKFVCSLKMATKIEDVSEFSFLQMISNTLEMRPLLKVKGKDNIEEVLVKYTVLEEEPSIYEPEYEDFINSVKTALFFFDWINEKDEEYLLEKYSIRPGEIRTKLEIADWLLYAASEIARILKLKSLIRELNKLKVRIKYGVKEELIPLLRLNNVGRVRARLLYKNGVKSIKDVKKVSFKKLAMILGEKIAKNVKEQVGQKVEVKIKKKCGQISLKDY